MAIRLERKMICSRPSSQVIPRGIMFLNFNRSFEIKFLPNSLCGKGISVDSNNLQIRIHPRFKCVMRSAGSHKVHTHAHRGRRGKSQLPQRINNRKQDKTLVEIYLQSGNSSVVIIARYASCSCGNSPSDKK